ncbi:MAG: type II secretion system minor pseudopilin GspK [Burkholderiaceae bacterium]
MNRQNGVAIISVLLTVALATIIVSGLFLREHITVRSVENRLALTQVRWIERAAIDWSKVILRADATSTKVDHLGEPWAIPVLDTRLDETVTAGAKIDDEARAATLSGQMIDAQSRFNLNNLVETGEDRTLVLSIPNLQLFQRLLDLLGLPQAIANTIASRILSYKQAVGAVMPESTGGSQQPGSGPLTGGVSQARDKGPLEILPMLRLSDLLAVRGVNAEALELLDGFVIFLPTEKTLINVGTAPAEILAALGDFGLEEARRLVTAREQVYWNNKEEFIKNLTGEAKTNAENLSDVKSSYFLVRGLIRFGRVESLTETLLRRSTKLKTVDVIWQRRI